MKSELKRIVDGKIEYRNESGQYHREDGPAIEHPNGNKLWFINGKLHREDGPAVQWVMEKYDEVTYWLNDEYYPKEIWEQKVIELKLKRISNI